ncbi:hypothetical protein [Aquimarina agarivorans]|uniref:hypothetical protein n=1 Tax=Aquimarina agarivorans TaxID=980584 RepID=UPI000248EA1E|nr:hypothetical protein [Aquimarina agarivorans]
MKKNDNTLEKFPSLEETIYAINKLNSKKWPIFDPTIHTDINKFIREIDDIITKEFGIFPSLLQPMNFKKFNLNIFRVREVSKFTNINIFSEHSYPPPSFTDMGRCNFPENPVFYAANHPGTALMEVSGNKNFTGKQYCISKWEIRESNKDLIFENYLRGELPSENLFKDVNYDLLEKLDQTFEKKLSIDKRKSIIKYLSFLDSCFINDHNYSLSAALAHRALFREHYTRTDILMYPSKQSLLKGVNFAINPNFASNYLYIKRFYIVTINSIEEDKSRFNISFQNYGTVDKGLTYWNKITKKDDRFENYIKEDFGESFYKNVC